MLLLDKTVYEFVNTHNRRTYKKGHKYKAVSLFLNIFM